MGRFNNCSDKGMPERVLLTGFRASGKSAVGRALARAMDYEFIDTDDEICRQTGSSVADLVSQGGWAAFRDLERKLLVDLCSRKKTVIATGGGAVLHKEEWKELRRETIVVWLKASLKTILQRLASDEKSVSQRPSLSGRELEEEVEFLLSEREPLYLENSDAAIDTDGIEPASVAGQIFAFITKSKNQMQGQETVCQEIVTETSSG